MALRASITIMVSKVKFLVVRLVREEEGVVLVAELKRPTEDTDAGRQVKAEYNFDETKYPTIYAIGAIGLSWTA